MLEKNCSGLILAGGRGQRMQTNAKQHTEKCLLLLNKKPLAEMAVASMPLGIKDIYISANTNQDSYQEFTRGQGRVMADDDCYPSYSGPLVGISTTLKKIDSDWLYVMPADVVFTPYDLFDQLEKTVLDNNSLLAFAVFDQRTHPLFMLINKKLYNSLNSYLLDEQRKVQYWVKQNGIACDVQANTSIWINDSQDLDKSLFLNINTPDDLQQAQLKISY